MGIKEDVNKFNNSIKKLTYHDHYIGKYKVDLYFIDYKLVIECDEFNHQDRNIIEEKNREEYICSLGNKIIRYNPN